MIRADLVVAGAAELATARGSQPLCGAAQAELEVVRNGVVAALDGEIVFVGSGDWRGRIELTEGARVMEAAGSTVLPGFVDPHTHAVFAGDRAGEFDKRLRGSSYAEIARAGGGILSTVRATRAAGEEELFELGRRRLDSMARLGTTTVEIKSGYGLEELTELKMLRVIARLGREHALTVVPTFMGAHEVPPEWRRREDGMRGYARLVAERMIPAVAEAGLAEYCDVFTETGVFDVEVSRAILAAAREAGMGLRVHADELTPLGGAELAAEMGAVSAEHLLHISERGVRAMAEGGTIAVLLPGTAFFLMMDDYAPARRLIEAGVPVALATDFNPGSSNCESVPMTITLACLKMRMSVAEAIVASTLNAACAVGRGRTLGTLEAGKRADIVILDAPSHFHLVYHWGVNHVRQVIKDGVPLLAGD